MCVCVCVCVCACVSKLACTGGLHITNTRASISGYLGCFHRLVTGNMAALKLGVQVSHGIAPIVSLG